MGALLLLQNAAISSSQSLEDHGPTPPTRSTALAEDL
jgi:hypothetical protein